MVPASGKASMSLARAVISSLVPSSLLTIIRTDKMRVVVDIPDNELPFFDIGRPITVECSPKFWPLFGLLPRIAGIASRSPTHFGRFWRILRVFFSLR
jgi:hypothetical protein